MRPTAEHFLSSIEHDSNALSTAASRGLDATVPTCPDWTIRDLVIHLGRIHRQKVSVLTEGRTDWDSTGEPPGLDLLEWFNEGAALLTKALRSVEPATAVWSWYAPDQTAGFWYRRMAHETLIHRVDAELSYDAITDIDPVVAEDGVDEALVIFISRTPAWATIEPGEAVIRLSTPDRHWSLREATYSGTTRSGRTFTQVPAVLLEPSLERWDCEISGEPADLNLWLWGRGPLSNLSVSGNSEHAEFLRSVASSST